MYILGPYLPKINWLYSDIKYAIKGGNFNNVLYWIERGFTLTDDMFTMACRHDQFEIAEHLYQYAYDSRIYLDTISTGRMDMYQFAREHNWGIPPDIVELACEYDVKTVEHFISMGYEITDIDAAYIGAITSRKPDIVKWLIERDYVHEDPIDLLVCDENFMEDGAIEMLKCLTNAGHVVTIQHYIDAHMNNIDVITDYMQENYTLVPNNTLHCT